MRVLLVAAILISTTLAKSQLDELAKAAMEVLMQSRVAGTIRQCRCSEEKACDDQFTQQALSCAPSCYGAFASVAANPFALKACIDQKLPVFQQFLECILHEAGSCNEYAAQPQVTRYDFRTAMQLGVTRVQQSRAQILSSSTFRNIQNFGGAALNFGVCVEGCVAQQNAAGTCFDRVGCNPVIEERRARRGLKVCLKRLNWKTHLGQLCDCALNAGVAELNRFCPILRLMASP